MFRRYSFVCELILIDIYPYRHGRNLDISIQFIKADSLLWNLPLSTVEFHGSLARLGLFLGGHVLRVLDAGLMDQQKSTGISLVQTRDV
jgi:hypothetical protein